MRCQGAADKTPEISDELQLGGELANGALALTGSFDFYLIAAWLMLMLTAMARPYCDSYVGGLLLLAAQVPWALLGWRWSTQEDRRELRAMLKHCIDCLLGESSGPWWPYWPFNKPQQPIPAVLPVMTPNAIYWRGALEAAETRLAETLATSGRRLCYRCHGSGRNFCRLCGSNLR